MELLQRLQPLDFLLAIAWAVAVAFGVRTGFLRQLVLLLIAYVAFIAANQVYHQGALVLSAFGFGLSALPRLRLFTYAFTFVVVLGGLGFLSWRVYPNLGMHGRDQADSVLGGIAGAVWGIVTIVGLITILRYFAVTPGIGEDATRLNVASQVQRSQLMPVLRFGLAPVWRGLAPWFPDELGEARALTNKQV